MKYRSAVMVTLAVLCICPVARGQYFQCGCELFCESHLEYDSYDRIAWGHSITYDYYYYDPELWSLSGVGIYTAMHTPINDSWNDEVRYVMGTAKVNFDRACDYEEGEGIICSDDYWNDGYGMYELSAVHVYDNENAGYTWAEVLRPLPLLPAGEDVSWDGFCEVGNGSGCWTQTLWDSPNANTWLDMWVAERNADGYTARNTCGVGYTGVTGGAWQVKLGGIWGPYDDPDTVGFTYLGVRDARLAGNAPCYSVAYQQMVMDVDGIYLDYGGVNYLYSTVPAEPGGQVISQKNSEVHYRTDQ